MTGSSSTEQSEESDQHDSSWIYRFAIGLLFLIIPISILFIWKAYFSIDAPIDKELFGTFGDFVGGFLGSIWSLCGVLLFYTALIEQRKDFKTNQKALTKQIDALDLQSEEFRLQREELGQSRQVFIEQSKTLRQQRLEATYFSLLNLYHGIISSLNSPDSTETYFKKFKKSINNKFTESKSPVEDHKQAADNYLEVFYDKKEELSHYFKLIYRILKIIDDSEITENEKFRYVKILRSQLSENEMLAMYYNSHSSYGGEVYKLILKYNLLKHLPSISKVEFLSFVLSTEQLSQGENRELDSLQLGVINRNSSKINRFNNEISKLLTQFLYGLKEFLNDDDTTDNTFKLSLTLPFCSSYLIAIESESYNELEIRIRQITTEPNENKILCFSREQFTVYFTTLLYDLFVFSRYINDFDSNKIVQSENESTLIYQVRMNKKLQTNTDIE